MATNLRLIAIFLIYIIVELLFAKFYFSIYKSQPNTYHFDQSVINQKISEVKKSHQNKLAQSGNVKYLEVFMKPLKRLITIFNQTVSKLGYFSMTHLCLL